ncbi:MAG: GIY-YIG nuclease family protein [Planctomycetota bacterium]|nr:GIY-YIG nuclease family protein [Planctomycetota bacterium]
MPHFVYLARCADDTLYVGRTEDLESPERTHNQGRGARYTASRRPVSIVYSEAQDSLEGAVRREHQLKVWTRAKKEALIAGDIDRLKRLSKHRS